MTALRTATADSTTAFLWTARRLLPVVTLFAMCGATLGAQGGASSGPAARVTKQAFMTLKWLEGRWRGSGGGYAAFYEEYRFLNDTTIEQREFPDSTFTRPAGTSTIVWSADAAQKLQRGRLESRIARVVGDTARFESANGAGGFTWIRVKEGAWLALLDGRQAPVRYSMQRVGR